MFSEMLSKESNNRKTLTENGAVAYATSGKNLLDFNFKLSQYRNMREEDIKKDFSRAFFEDPLIATKFVFYVGDVRGGLGERRTFNICMDWLVENKPEIAIRVLEFIPEYTRWDNLTKIVLTHNNYIRSEVISIIRHQLSSDVADMVAGKPISLCAKWMPSINASSKETRRKANIICNALGFTPKHYRKTLSALRKYLDVVEVNISANAWDKVDYEKVPSLANLKYKNAFLKHDWDRRIEYLGELSTGHAKINASVTQPHEIVNKYMNNDFWGSNVNDYDETLEQMWKALPDVSVEDTLVVRDGSYSMTCPSGSGHTTCMDVATALTIYCAEHNSKEWKDKFITFSAHPKFVGFKGCNTLRDKLIYCSNETEASNTDIEATMRLILNTAVKNNVSQEDMPSNILIISDMQFDGYWDFNWDKTIFEQISEEYKFYGYKLPRIIFWNVASRNSNTIPMQDNERGLILCSGFSIANLNMFMSGELDPYKVLVEQINTERYDVIEEAVKDVI